MPLAILVTGANGFVGTTLCPALAAAGHRVRRAVRELPGVGSGPSLGDTVAVGDIGPDTDWAAALAGIDVVVHLAGRAHVMREVEDDLPEIKLDVIHATEHSSIVPPKDYRVLQRYRRVNVAGSERLARAAAAAGVRRLVFASSIKVNGESTTGMPYRETDRPRPEDAYGVSKAEAEVRLRAVAAETGLEVVIVRPPLVYGPGVKGNLDRLLRALDHAVPLPLGGIDNRRSLVGLSNLCAALRLCAEHPAAAEETFLVCDGDDVSTSRLAAVMARALGRRPPVAFPNALRLLLRLAGARGAQQRLFGSLAIDASHIQDKLGWRPVASVEQEIAAMTQAYRDNAR
jgi:nucleoside-diphosphate-sugar epimerase